MTDAEFNSTRERFAPRVGGQRQATPEEEAETIAFINRTMRGNAA